MRKRRKIWRKYGYVFCKDCFWLKIEKRVSSQPKYCDNPRNIKYVSNYYDRSIEEVRRRWPDKINKRNRCKWFKEKEDKDQ